MWDQRFSSDAYAYGTEPNDFLREHVKALPKGRVLSLAEGEGRNAVFLAKQGYEVTAVDSSAVGLEKAQQLAKKQGVVIECIQADLANFDIGEDCWDAIVSIYSPLGSQARKLIHQRVMKGLKKGGVFLTESYTPAQVHYGTGGGDDADTVQSKASLAAEFPQLEFIDLKEVEREVVEGIYHTGLASVVQAIGKK